MIAMHLIEPKGGRRKWRVRFVNHDGAIRAVSGYAEEEATVRLKHRLISLVSAKLNGDPPPRELAPWFESMEPKLAARLIKLGLLDRRRREQVRPITDHIVDYEKCVVARSGNTAKHGADMASKVRALCAALKIATFADVIASEVVTKVNELVTAPATRRGYLVAMRDFCGWMIVDKRAVQNPLADVVLPKAVPQTDRKPFTVDELRRLMAYLTTFDRYPHQLTAWGAADRRLLYWFAVKTGLRINVLRQMTVGWLRLGAKPAAVVVPAKVQKNKAPLEVPIPADLAGAMAEHVGKKMPAAPVFQIPEGKAVMFTLRKDLKGAKVDCDADGADVRDFHTFRSTAITWWLEEDGLSQLVVQRLAGLKTLAMVQRYSRNFKVKDTSWLNRGPKVDVQVGKARAG